MPLFGEREGLGGTSSLGLVRSFARFSRASGFENDENIANYRELINKYSKIYFFFFNGFQLKRVVELQRRVHPLLGGEGE